MRSLEEIARTAPDVRLSVTNDDSTSGMLLQAATEAGVDLEDEQARLHDVSDGDALDRLHASAGSNDSGGACITVLHLWDRTFVIHPDTVEVYC